MTTKTQKPEPQLYAIEFTDTFGGEANYCWCERFRVWAPDIGRAITLAKQHRYTSPLPRHTLKFCTTDSARIDIKNANICAFIDWTEPTEYTPGDGENHKPGAGTGRAPPAILHAGHQPRSARNNINRRRSDSRNTSRPGRATAHRRPDATPGH